MTFKEYVNSRRVTDTPRGDFIADAKSDSRMPEISSWSELESYLLTRNGSAAIPAAKAVWRAYVRKYRR